MPLWLYLTWGSICVITFLVHTYGKLWYYEKPVAKIKDRLEGLKDAYVKGEISIGALERKIVELFEREPWRKLKL